MLCGRILTRNTAGLNPEISSAIRFGMKAVIILNAMLSKRDAF